MNDCKTINHDLHYQGMDDFIALYQQRLGLQKANFSRIDHEDAMVATVFKMTP